MARGRGHGHHWQPPRELNDAPPTRTAPHMGETHRDDVFGNPGSNTNLKGMGGRSGGEGKSEVKGDGWNNKRGNLPATT